MSEIHKTYSRPLASTAAQQQQLGQPILNITTTATDKPRKRQSTSSNGPLADNKQKSARHRSAATKVSTTTSDTASSRTVQRSTTGPSSMSTVNYTKTGRVSKAKKGLKVHDCECGRSYTRAEHLRRHQRNHAQEGAMVCKYPSCGKTFFRADLLQRHEERHEELGNTSRQPSVSSTEYSSTHTSPSTVPATLPVATSIVTSSAASFPQHQYSMSPRLEVTPFPRYNPSLFRAPQPPRTPKAAPLNFSSVLFHPSHGFKAPMNDSKHQSQAFPARHSISGPILADGVPTTGVWHESFAHSPYSCSSGYASPVPGPECSHVYATPPYTTGVVRTRASSNASFLEQTWAHASQSPTSSASIPYSWPPDDKSVMPTSFPYISATYPMTSISTVGVMSHYAQYDPHSMVQMDNEEGAQLFPGEHYGMSQIAHAFPFEHWLNNYWRLFHPTFPVVHRFTLTCNELSPLLYAAMIAIDLQISHDVSQRHKALELHKTCTKLLTQREQSGRPACNRLCDDQSIFLVEVFSQYCAQRCSKTLSVRFELMYEKLANMRSVHPSSILGLQLLDPAPEEYIQDRWTQWSQLSARQHLLLSCYLLESQQRTLLARDRQLALSTMNHDLPFPVHESLWSAGTASEWAALSQQQLDVPRTVSEALQSRCQAPFDIFQSAVLIAATFDQSSGPVVSPSSDIKHLLSCTRTTQLQLLTTKLTQLSPMRALLSVSGETWLLGTKLTSKEECAALKYALHDWTEQIWAATADDSPSTISEALKISVAILELSLDASEPLTLGLGNELGLLLAAVVLWSATAAATNKCSALGLRTQHLQSPFLFDSNLSGLPQTEPVPQANTVQPRNSAVPNLPERRSSMPWIQIFSNSSRFLPTALNEISSFNLATCQLGCTSILLWVRMHLQGAFSNGLGANEVRTTDHGEIMNAAIGQIERMLDHGWEGWGI